jgi:hypothetical protein
MSSTDAVQMHGLDTDRLPASLTATAALPDMPEYRHVRSTFVRGGSPAIVLRPTDVAGVADAIHYASDHREVPLGVARSKPSTTPETSSPTTSTSRRNQIESTMCWRCAWYSLSLSAPAALSDSSAANRSPTSSVAGC